MRQFIEKVKGRSYFEGCHKHRLVPGFLGGEYEEENVVFLTQQEHKLVHFIRWKIYNDVRDKRSYKMIGVGPSGLSYEDRKELGISCVDKKLGIHGADPTLRNLWRDKGRATQVVEASMGVKNWVFWSSQEGRKERARIGGIASYGKNQAFLNQQCSFKNTNKASYASSLSSKKPVTDGKGTIKKFHTESERELFLSSNPTWRKGCPTKKEKLKLGK